MNRSSYTQNTKLQESREPGTRRIQLFIGSSLRIKNGLFLLMILSVSYFSSVLANSGSANKIYPKISVNDNGKNYPLKLKELAINVNVVGNIAVTTYKMVFINTENRIMEGELEFPLAEGQMISRFAMDMNGILREGVVVEKAKGRETFEKIVRRGVDPGLIEQTKGNVFRSRVYPIPANGTKTIVVSYEQELTDLDNNSLYILPLQFESKIEHFSINVEVLKQPFQLSSTQNQIANFSFDTWEEIYKARAEFDNYCPDRQLAFEIPQTKNYSRVYVERISEESDSSYFYLHLKPQLISQAKILPRKVCLIWDASGSSVNKDKEKELELLEAYFKEIGTLEVTLIIVRNDLEEPLDFSIKEGDCSKFLRNMRNIKYDGGTQLGILDLDKYPCDEFILSCDGMSNFGAAEIKLSKTPVMVLNSNVIADYSYLKYVALATGGRFINLTKLSVQDALSSLSTQEYHFISAKCLSSAISEVYPSVPTAFSNSFSLSGKLKGKNGVVVLNYGFGSSIIRSDTIEVSRLKGKSAGLLRRLWAEKAISELDMRYENNKEKITALGKEHSIVTRNTSLIVLDRIEDYVDNQILPPADMQKEYFAMLQSRIRTMESDTKNHIEQVVWQFEQRIQWWNRDQKSFKREVVAKSTDRSIRSRSSRRVRRNTISMAPSGTQNYDHGRVTLSGGTIGGGISGVVTDISTGEPLPGVAIIINNTTTGTISDIDGKYRLNIFPGATVKFMFIGYKVEEVTPGENGIVDVALAPDISSLEEVVVVGYGTAREDDSFSNQETEDEESTDETDNRRASIVLSGWDPQTPYIAALKEVSKNQFYNTYLEFKKEYESSPSFYLDVADFFNKNGEQKLALRVLSNIAELKTEDHQLLRVLAHRLQQLGYFSLAVKVFRDVLSIREEEPQSFRDLALALADNNQPQEAIDMLYYLIQKRWDGRFSGVELIAVGELNNIVAKTTEKLDLSKIDKRLIKNMPVNVRVVLNWDADNCDMDLWVTSPDGEKCYYGNKTTQTGGQISNDFTGGYGPEEFLIKQALTGNYKIEVDYYGTSQQKVTGPTTIQVELYTSYGTRNQKKQEITMRLGKSKEIIDVGKLLFKE